MMPDKMCRVCKQVKPVSEFQEDKRNSDGYTSWCRPCKKEWQTNYDKKNKERRTEYLKQWHIENKEKQNKLVRDRSKERWDNDPEYRARKNKWKYDNYHAKTHLRERRLVEDKLYNIIAGRSKPQKGFATKEQWENLLEKVDNRCVRCGEKKKLTVDHIIPAPDGPSTISNLQPLCNECNASKGSHTINYKDKFIKKIASQ